MAFLRTFLHSIRLPGKKAVFALNRTGMDIAVIYMFILMLLISVPSFVHAYLYGTGPYADLNLLFLSIYFFIFYYLPMTVIVFLLLSLIAYAGAWIASMTKRKLRFSILWKMCVFLSTVPFVVYTIIALIFDIPDTFLWFGLLYTFLLLLKVISIYPPLTRKKR
jgi:hypothetical protein